VLGLLSSTVQSAEPLQGGDAGTEQTIGKIRELVNDAWKNLDVRRLAICILREAGAPQYDDWSKVRAIYDWVSANFYFVLDPVTKEVLMPFPDLVELGAGDCDEINATAMAVLLGVIGYEPRLVTVAADAGNPEAFSHVYAEVLVNGNWVPMDAARPGAQIGKAPESWYRRTWWSLTDDFYADYPGPGQLDGLRATASRRRRLAGLNGYGLGSGYIDDTGTWVDTSGQFDSGAIGPGITDISTPGPSFGIDWGTVLTTGLQDVSKILPVVQQITQPSALRTPIGPGGYSSVSPTGGTALMGNPFAGMNSSVLLLLLGGGLLLFAMSRR
jgi:hypothetical protein